jgi:hypothetical protein
MSTGLQEVRILSGISPTMSREDGGRRAVCVEINLFVTISITLRCKGIILARTRAASVEVDLNSRPMTSAKGRWAALREATTRFLRIAEAQTEQLYRIMGITEDLYRSEIVLRDKPQDNRQHFRMRNNIFLTALHLIDMCRFQLSLSSIVIPRYKHELDLETVMLSTVRDRGGKLRFGEKVKKNDLAPLKANLTERPQATTASHIV